MVTRHVTELSHTNYLETPQCYEYFDKVRPSECKLYCRSLKDFQVCTRERERERERENREREEDGEQGRIATAWRHQLKLSFTPNIAHCLSSRTLYKSQKCLVSIHNVLMASWSRG